MHGVDWLLSIVINMVGYFLCVGDPCIGTEIGLAGYRGYGAAG